MPWVATLAVIGVLVLVNLLSNRWAPRQYLLLCVASTILLLGIGYWDGLSWEQMGLARSTWVTGLIWSAVLFAGVVIFYAIAAAIPMTRKGFNDKEAAQQGWVSITYHAAIRIPFGTALMEETAFRAVLLAVVADGWGWAWGVAVSSVLFGFWHVLPSWNYHERTAVGGTLGTGRRAQVTSITLNVLGTGVAGVVFCLLRGASGSIFPPMVLHAALNGVGLAVTWAFARRLRDL